MQATAKNAIRLPATKPAPSLLTSSDIVASIFAEQNDMRGVRFRSRPKRHRTAGAAAFSASISAN
jgi:hypothetical protein